MRVSKLRLRVPRDLQQSHSNCKQLRKRAGGGRLLRDTFHSGETTNEGLNGWQVNYSFAPGAVGDLASAAPRLAGRLHGGRDHRGAVGAGIDRDTPDCVPGAARKG